MCCLVTILALLGPRAGVLVWWLMDTPRWTTAFDGWLIPMLGFVFLPWTTLGYVLVSPGGIQLFDWVWLGIAILIDLGAYAGGGYNGRNRMRS